MDSGKSPSVSFDESPFKSDSKKPMSLSRKKFSFKKKTSTEYNDSFGSDTSVSMREDVDQQSMHLKEQNVMNVTANAYFVTGIYRELTKNPAAFAVQKECVSKELIHKNTYFIYDALEMINEKDKYWRLDQFEWNNLRSVQCSYNGVFWKVQIHQLLSQGVTVDFYRKEFRLLGQEWEDRSCWNDPHVYIVYYSLHNTGHKDFFELSSFEGKSCHGNVKQNKDKAKYKRLRAYLQSCDDVDIESEMEDFAPSQYYRSSERCKNRIREEIMKGSTPLQAQSTVLNEAVSKPVVRREDLPRNRHQVYQFKYNSTKGSTVEDELAEVWKLSYTSKFVPLVKILHQKMLTVMLSPTLTLHLSEVLRMNARLTCHLDTTYDVGQFYCTILAFKHPFLESNPVIPLAFVFHQCKSYAAHSDFLEIIASKLPALNSNKVSFVSDREAAIKLAIAEHFPLANKAYCHRHIKEDVLHWRYATLPQCERVAFANDVDYLLRCLTQTDFDEFLCQRQKEWSSDFAKYFNTYLKADVVKSCRVHTEPLGIFYPLGGVSNNPSESMNSVYKQFLGKKSPSTMLEALYKSYLFCFAKFNMVKQAVMYGCGDYKLIPAFFHIKENMQFKVLERSVDLASLQGIFDSGTFTLPVVKLPQDQQLSFEQLAYKGGIAELFVKTDRVKISGGQFCVTDLDDNPFHVNAVDESCTCGGTRCVHYLAVEKIIRKPEILASGSKNRGKKSNRNFTLSKLSKRSISQKAGKKAHVVPRLRKSLFPIIAPRRVVGQEVIASQSVNTETLNLQGNYSSNFQSSPTPSPRISAERELENSSIPITYWQELHDHCSEENQLNDSECAAGSDSEYSLSQYNDCITS